MTDLIKTIIQEILQMRLDGKIHSVHDMLTVIDKHIPGDNIPYYTMLELGDYCQELLPCDNIPAAKAFAEKYGLTIVC